MPKPTLIMTSPT